MKQMIDYDFLNSKKGPIASIIEIILIIAFSIFLLFSSMWFCGLIMLTAILSCIIYAIRKDNDSCRKN